MPIFALRPGDIKRFYFEWLPLATATAYGAGAAEFALTGGRSTSGLIRANRMASFVARSHWNAFAAMSKTPLVRGGTATIGSAVGGVIGGYVLGAAVGTGIAHAWKGEKGSDAAIDLYTFQVSPGEYLDTVEKKFSSMF